jgi:hypothetical protein
MCIYDTASETCIGCGLVLVVNWKLKQACGERGRCGKRKVEYRSNCYIQCGCADKKPTEEPTVEPVEEPIEEEKRGKKRKRSESE